MTEEPEPSPEEVEHEVAALEEPIEAEATEEVPAEETAEPEE